MQTVDNRVHLAKLIGKKEIAKNILECVFHLEKKMEYVPGQYIWVELSYLPTPDPHGSRRPFSLVSIPDESDTVTIVFNQTESGFNKSLQALNVGDEVRVIGPHGFSFCLPENKENPLFFFAGGTGATPFVSLIRSAVANKLQREITLIWANDNNEDFFYKDELESIIKENPQIKVKFLAGKIEFEHFKEHMGWERALCYVSGPQGFVDYVYDLGKKNGIFEHQFQFENYYPTPEQKIRISDFFKDGEVKISPDEPEHIQRRARLLFKLVSSTSGHMIVTDIDGKIIFANKAAQNITGFSFAEMVGNTPRLWGGLMTKEFYRELWESKKNGKSINAEIVNRRKNGETYFASAHISPVKDDEENIIGFIGAEEDITYLKEQQRKIAESEERWQFALEGSKDGVWDWNLVTNEVMFSHQWKAMLGYNDDEIGSDVSEWSRRVHPDDLKAAEAAVEAHIKGERPFYKSEHRVLMKNGQYKWILDRGKVTSYKDGVPLRMVGTHTDIDEIRSRENQLRSLTARLNLATSSAKIGVWEWDVLENKLIWDDQMYVLYGIKKEDFGGAYDAWQQGLHPDDRKSGDDAIQAALKGEKDFSPQFRVVWPNGEIHYIQAHAVVERDSKGKPLKMIGVNWDITNESIVDREKTEFVSLASHQLKTPIGSIQWNLEMLLAGDYGPVPDKQKEVLSDAYTMGKRMNDLVNALLNISRIEMGVFIIEPKPTDFAKLCEEVIKEMEPRLLKKGHELTKNLDANISQIPADEKLLRIVFQNFISNAIKYTPDKGKIKVSLKTDDKSVVFSVANNGAPIPESDQSKIFTKMFRASNAQEQDPDGNGLGLYVVKQIVENSGGKIWFTSKNGEETVFACSFPLSGMVAKSGTKQLD